MPRRFRELLLLEAAGMVFGGGHREQAGRPVLLDMGEEGFRRVGGGHEVDCKAFLFELLRKVAACAQDQGLALLVVGKTSKVGVALDEEDARAVRADFLGRLKERWVAGGELVGQDPDGEGGHGGCRVSRERGGGWWGCCRWRRGRGKGLRLGLVSAWERADLGCKLFVLWEIELLREAIGLARWSGLGVNW